MTILAYALFALLCLAGPAAAEPVSTTIMALKLAFASMPFLTKLLIRVVISVGLSMLDQRRRDQRKRQIDVGYTTSGGTQPQEIILGRFATAGHRCYHNSHGKNNVFYTQVLELSDMPGVSLERIILEGAYSELGETPHPEFGYPILSKRSDRGNDYAWIRFYDGTQTSADPDMVDAYGSDSDRPWTAQHILAGVAYAKVTFKGNSKVWTAGRPEMRFELLGHPIYDPRKDSSVGGSGAQRWSDPATWAASENPVVLAYNVMRGITLPDGNVWGGGIDAADLPLSDWVAGMNTCDEALTTSEGSRPRYRGGIRVTLDQEPKDVVQELLAACNGRTAELGGAWRLQVGAPASAVAVLTDDDLLSSQSEDFEPFPGLTGIYNTISITHPSRALLWKARELEPVVMEDLVAEDGLRRPFELRLAAVPWGDQARQLGKELILDHRRFRRHTTPLPPDYFFLDPLNVFDWSSEWHSYSGKSFEISEIGYDLRTLAVTVSAKEVDPADFVFDETLEIPEPPAPTPVPAIVDAGLPGFAVDPVKLKDASGNDRRPAILVTWDGSEIATTTDSVEIEVLLAEDGSRVPGKVTQDVEGGSLLLDMVLPDTAYEVRGLAVSRNRETSPTAWFPVTTYDIRLNYADLVADVQQEIDQAQATAESADDRAQAVRDDHDALVNGFVGDLPTKFGQVANDIDTKAAETLNLAVSTASQMGLGVITSQFLDQGWETWTNPPTRVANEVHASGETISWNILAGVNSGVRLRSEGPAWIGQVNADAYVVEVEYELLSGTVDGAGVLFDWNIDPSGEHRQQKTLAEMTSGPISVGKLLTARAVLRKAEGAGGPFLSHDVYLMGSYPGLGTQTAKHIKFHKANVRLATAEEMGGGEVKASIEEFAATKVDLDTALTLLRKTLHAGLSPANEVHTPNASNPENVNSDDLPIGQWSDTQPSTDVPTYAPVGAKSLVSTDGAREMPGRMTPAAGRTFKVSGWTKTTGAYKPVLRATDGAILAAYAGAFETNTSWAFKTWFVEVGSSVSDLWCPGWDLAGAEDEVFVYDLRWEDVTELDATEASLSGYIEEILALDLSALSGTALAILLNQLGVQSDGTSATIANIQSTKVDAAGAVGAVTQEISATYGDLTALAEAAAFAEATLDGISSGFVWSLDEQEILSLVRIDDGVTGPGTSAKIAADLILLSGETVVEGGFFTDVLQAKLAWIKSANIGDLEVDTIKVAEDAITVFDVAGSGAITNNSSTPTPICSVSLDTELADSSILGVATVSLSTDPSSLPSNFEINAYVGGILVGRLNLQAANQAGGVRRHTLSLSRTGISGSPVVVELEMKNMGGQGINTSNLWALARKK